VSSELFLAIPNALTVGLLTPVNFFNIGLKPINRQGIKPFPDAQKLLPGLGDQPFGNGCYLF